MSEISQRLAEALKASKVRSMRALWSALAEAGTYEATYSTVHRYFAGEVEPPLDFLSAAGDVLNVRPAWLAFGEEPAGIARSPNVRPIGVTHFAYPAGEPLLEELVSKLCAAQPPGAPDLSDADLSTVTGAIDRHLTSTIGALTKRSTGGLDGTAGRFAVLALMAMLAAVPGPGEGRPLGKVLAMLPQGPDPRDHLELASDQENIDDE